MLLRIARLDKVFYFDQLTTDAKISSSAEGNVLEAINLAINGRGTPFMYSMSPLVRCDLS